MSQALIGRLAVKAKQIRPGEVFAAEIRQGQLVEITDMEGHQVAQFVAFALPDPKERLSAAVSRTENGSIMIQEGMKLYSNRGTELFTVLEDSVGRHDLLAGWGLPSSEFTNQVESEASAEQAAPAQAEAASTDADADAAAVEASAAEGESQAASEESAEGTAEAAAIAPATTANGVAPEQEHAETEKAKNQLAAVNAALEPWGLTADDLPDPVNWFMNQAILQRGELEVREPISERGDHIVVQALQDAIVVVRASDRDGVVNGGKPTDLMVRVFR